MYDTDSKLFFIGELLQHLFPQAISDAARAAPIRSDKDLLFARIERLSPLLPPPSDTLHGKFGCLMINADGDLAAVVNQIVDPRLGWLCRKPSERKS